MSTASKDATAGSRTRRRRVSVWIVAVLAALVALFYLGGGWYFSNLIAERALDGEERRAALAPDYDLEVESVGDGTVSLRLPEDPGALLTDGIWGLEWRGGYGQVGAVRSSGGGVVVRDFTHLTGSELTIGTLVDLDERAFPQDPAVGLGIHFEEVTYEGELGSYPAWFVDGDGSTWVILVNGNAMTQRDGLRLLSIVTELGYPSLTITYRNDEGAPEDPRGMLRYGLTEWRDVQAAVRYAIDSGATDVVLAGFSMGGGIVVNFLYRSSLADLVRSVILEAPMLDFGRTVDFQASREELPFIGLPLPRSLTAVAKWLADLRFGVDWGALDYLEDVDRLEVPILLFHGTEDLDVPEATSAELAAARPDLVEYARVARAAHMECWNVDPDAYAEAVAAFLGAAT